MAERSGSVVWHHTIIYNGNQLLIIQIHISLQIQFSFIMPAHQLLHERYSSLFPPNLVLIHHARAPATARAHPIRVSSDSSNSCWRTSSSTRKQFAFPSTHRLHASAPAPAPNSCSPQILIDHASAPAPSDPIRVSVQIQHVFMMPAH